MNHMFLLAAIAAVAVAIRIAAVSVTACSAQQCELSEQEMAALRNYRVEYSYWSVKPAHFHIAETDR